MPKKLLSIITAGLLLFGAFAFFRFTDFGAGVLWSVSDAGKLLLPLVAVAALIDSINPCAFSVLLLTLAFLVSMGKLHSHIVQIGGAYILGIFFAYLLIGLGILHALHLFNTPHFMGRVGAILLIALGVVNVINEFFPAFPVKLKIPSAAHHTMANLMGKASIPTAFVLGGLVGLCEFPCTGGPYLMVLGLLHDQATYLAGVGYLIFYNAIFVLPLVLVLLFASDTTLLDRVKSLHNTNRRAMRFGGGIATIALGVIIFLL